MWKGTAGKGRNDRGINQKGIDVIATGKPVSLQANYFFNEA